MSRGDAVCWSGCSKDSRGTDKSRRPGQDARDEKLTCNFKIYLTDRQNIKTCAVKCSYEEPLWSEGLNDNCMPSSETENCLAFKMSAFREISIFFAYSPCNVGHREVSPDSVIKALSVVWNMIKIPDCLAWLGHITVPHLWNDFAPHYLVPVRLKHQVAAGYVHNLGNMNLHHIPKSNNQAIILE